MLSALVIAAALAAGPSPAVAGPAPVVKSRSPAEVRVVAGDLLMIRSQPVRLYGVAAPDAAQRCTTRGASWTCGMEATTALRQLVSGQNVSCQPLGIEQVAAVGEINRIIAQCYVGRLDLGGEMVAAGLAVPSAGTPYHQSALDACMERKGIWRSDVESPWTFRARREGRLVNPLFLSRGSGTPCAHAFR